jgi:NAD(P)H-flavin reductase
MPRATISEREPAGGGLERVRLLVDEKTARTHSRHGQYIEVRHDGPSADSSEDRTIPGAAKGYFAIASAPREPTWDILVRDSGAMGARLHELPIGESVIVSNATGPGFPVERASARPLMVAVTGSGIAAVLSTIGARIEDGDSGRTFVLYGVRDRSELALLPELDAMRAAGVDVAVCLSREHINEPGFFRGYVQDVARTRQWRLSNGLVFAAGNEAMIHGVRKAAPDLGLLPDDVHVNS